MPNPDRPTEAMSVKAEQIYLELRPLDAGARETALDRVCAGDDALRAAVAAMFAQEQAPVQFESLIDDLAAAEHVFAFGKAPEAGGGAVGAGDAVTVQLAARGETERPGTVIGVYRLLDRLGEGGFGTVFMAEQQMPVRRRVALKIIKLGMDTRQVVARFEAERQALAMMDHPCIAKVFDAGATATGRPYFVMELVKGQPITQYCDQRKLSVRERLELLRQVCDAVHHAHQKGIIHRDLKPSNILVSEPASPGAAPAPRVIDFGIAKATSGRLTESTIFTEIRQMIGTPEYMSPEQAGVTAQDVDTRTDVYSLGVILYELLAGSTPFESRRLRAAAYGEVQRIIREEDPPKPSTRVSSVGDLPGIALQRQIEPERLRAVLRGEIDWIVMKCLEKDRARRYGSAAELAADLGRFLANQPIAAKPTSAAYTVRKLVQRHRGAFAAAAVIALVMVIGVAGTAIGLVSSLRANRKLDVALAESRQRAEELEAVAEFQAAQLKDIEPDEMARRLRATLVTESRTAMERDGVAADAAAARLEQFEQMLDESNLTNVALATLDENIFRRALKAVDEQFKSQPLVRARLLQTIALTLSELGMVDRAVEPLARALALRREQLGEDHPDTIDSLDASVYLLMAQGKHDEAEPIARDAVERARRVLGPDDRITLNATLHLGGVLRQRNKLDEAEVQLRTAVEGTRRVLGEQDPDTISAVSSLGQLLYSRGRLEEAEPYYRAVYEGYKASLGEGSPTTLRALSNLGVAVGARGRIDEAAACFRAAWMGQRHALGDDHPDGLTSLQSLGNALIQLQRFDEAEPLVSEALARSRRSFGDDHPKTVGVVGAMAAVLNHAGKFDEAAALLTAAEPAARRAWGGKNGTRLGAFLLRLADARLGLGQFAAAEAVLLECHGLYSDTTYGDPQSGLRKTTQRLIELYEAWDQAEPGKGYGGRAVEWRARVATEPK